MLSVAVQALPQLKRLTDWAPYPFDFLAHASNAGGSFLVSYGISYGVAKLAARFNRSPERVAAVAITVGAVALAAANAIVETKTGYKLLHTLPGYNAIAAGSVGPNSVVDPADLAWGVAGGIGGATLVAADIKAPEAIADEPADALVAVDTVGEPRHNPPAQIAS